MTSREESEALMNLQELLARDLSKVSLDELYQGIKESELVFDQAQVWTGRLVAEVRRRPNVSWSKVEEATGVPKATLDRRASKAP
ncbi:hypothetical protein I4I73_21340 [Pseudonocardia sp. KRD-184]|uniref:Uncharacterized protein n=1 Tax=Pseudonocardia oceani TaxID=2792013 RepID=A0ABS6UFX8_9PSEU|nr:hypothetical protein [Pseudonocardia oceani]MBW0090511.1 hypothetical protein [Pseudonocardia oceani]MBW0098536.1 hypothetical protein [Pseudonocardia oceani]MBW0124376.1 hypothetical protein [Pseudonocardia oceani]MBW0131146.1 hypothetical protein [Pseudonocardia oceani]MBW0132592.1 hypothetical protein [Pseudonocardia oceani]